MSGMSSEFGIGKETTYGTGVASSVFFQSADLSINEEDARLRDPFHRGHRGTPTSDAGRLNIAGSVSNIMVRPDNFGHLLRGLLGAPTTAGSGPYTHTYVDSTTKFSSVCAVPPYSLTVDYDGTDIRRYDGGVINQLTLSQDSSGRLSSSADFIFKGRSDVSSETPSYETNKPFNFSQLNITRAGSNFVYAENVTITINNNLIAVPLLDESKEVSCVEFNDTISIGVSMTIDPKDSATLYGDMKNNTNNAWVFTWDDGTDSLVFTFPQLNVLVPNKPITGAGRTTFTANGTAEYNTAAGYSVEVVLTNSQATY